METDREQQQDGDKAKDGAAGRGAVSGRDKAVDHERQPGVPPPSNDDQDGVDRDSAESFPASDPPANY